MKNPFVRFIVATLAAGLVLFGLVCIFTLLGWNGKSIVILFINGFITITVWKTVYAIGAEEETEADESNTENKE